MGERLSEAERLRRICEKKTELDRVPYFSGAERRAFLWWEIRQLAVGLPTYKVRDALTQEDVKP